MIKMFNKDYLREYISIFDNVIQDDVIKVDYKYNIYHNIVFKDTNGIFWCTFYWENIYEHSWEYEEEIKCVQVVPQKVLKDAFVLMEDKQKYEDEIRNYILEDDGK